MLTSPFKFLGFNRQAKTPKSAPLNDKKTKGKLRKARNPNTPVDIVDRSTSMKAEEKADISTVHPEEKDSGEYHQMQPAGILLNSQETAGQPDIDTDVIHAFSPHTQTYETSHLSSSISEDPDFSEGSGKPRGQTPASVAPTRLWSSIPSTRRGSFGGREGIEWDDDRGGVRDWRDGVSNGPDIPKHNKVPRRITLPNVDPDQHDVQEHHDIVNDSQKQNNQLYQPIVFQASPPEKDENHARRENISKHDDHREANKAALGDGNQVEDNFEPEICYYIVPAGLDIIFQDEDGTEITRVGKIKGTQDQSSHVHSKNIPIVIQDVLGNELFRSWTLHAINDPPQRDQGLLHDPDIGMVDAMAGDNFLGRRLPSPSHPSWKAIIVDEKGNQIPLKKYAERK